MGICANSAPMAQLTVFDTRMSVQLMASTNFAMRHRLIGTETLLIASLGTEGSASVDSFTGQFSETPARVPEPTSLAVLGAGGGRAADSGLETWAGGGGWSGRRFTRTVT